MNPLDQYQEDHGTPCNETVEQRIMGDGVQFFGEENINDAASEYIDFATSLLAECKAKLALANLDTVVFLFRQVVGKRPFAHPLSSVATNDLVSVLLLRFLHTGQINDWHEAFDIRIARIQNILNGPTALTIDIVSFDENEQDTKNAEKLARECLAEVHALISLDDLNNVVFFLRTSLDTLCSNEAEPLKVKAWTTLADALYTRYRVSNDVSDLVEAISNLDTAFKHIHKFGAQSILAQPDLEMMEKRMQAMMMERVSLNEDFNLEDQFTDALRASGKDAREPRNYRYAMSCADMFDRASASVDQFKNGKQFKNLDEGIALHRQVLEARPFPNPYRAGSLYGLATALAIRYNNGAQISDLEEALSLYKEALNLSSPQLDRGNVLYSIAGLLTLRYNQKGQKHDLDDAVSMHRQSLELRPITHPHRYWSLIYLGNALLTQSQLSGKSEVLDEVVNLQREAVDLCPSPNPGLPHTLGSLANALWIRFRYGSQREDLDEAIMLFRQSLELFEETDAHRYATINNFATALVNRFEFLGKASDLDDAIFWQKQSVDYFQAMEHPERHTPLNNLSNMLALRYQRGRKSDLDDAILSQRQVLELRPRPHPDRASCLNNLGNSLLTRFSKEEHHDQDLEEAISLHREALDLRPPPNSNRYTTLVNLANSISERFECAGDENDFQEVVSLHREAVELLPPEHPKRYASFHNLGKIFWSAYPILGEKKEYLDEAIASFTSGLQCPSLSPSQRLLVAKSWAYAADQHHHSSAIIAYDTVLQVVRELSSLSLDIKSRQEVLTTGSDGLALKAARCAIQRQNYEKAIEYLETGRAVVWSQILHLRTPLDRLQEVAPEMAEKLRHIASQLEIGSHRSTFAEPTDNQRNITLEEEALALESLSREWSRLIDGVRTLEGFEDFLKPPRMPVLRAAASRTPVVFLIPDYDSSHCLIMTSTNIHHIHVPALPVEEIRKLVQLLQVAAARETVSRSLVEGLEGNMFDFGDINPISDFEPASERGVRPERALHSDDIFKHILKTLWDEVVKPVIDVLGIKISDTRPTIQWCPTGLFTFLPIHAAGCYDSQQGLANISDYIISSYTPTLERLFSDRDVKTSEVFEMLAVVDMKRLSCAGEELRRIQARVPNEHLVQLGIPGSPSRMETILSHLSTANIVHFACHGTQNRAKPLDSALLVEDGMLTIAKIIQKPMPNGSLAFLCACETAMGDEALPDEAISLGASLLFSGFRSVVATMWQIQDKDGPVFADAFYEELFKGPVGVSMSRPDVTQSVRAFDSAVKRLRSEGAAFRHWVPFVHLGQ